MTREEILENERVITAKLTRSHIQILLFLLAQTGAAIWWAAATSADIAYLKESTRKSEASYYADLTRLDSRLSKIELYLMKERRKTE